MSRARDLERVQKNAKQVEKLARKYKTTNNVREAQKISQQMAKLSKEIQEATRIQEELDKYEKKLRKSG